MNTIFKLRNFLFSFGRIVDKALAKELSITLPQFAILTAISHKPSGTQAVFAEMRKISPAAVSKQIDLLLKNKLITRKNSKKDRREHSILITPKGKIILKKSMDIFERHQEKVFKHVSKNSRKQFNQILDTLLTHIDKSSVCK